MVSIIIPARNEKYLEQTIRSVLSNAKGEIEVLVILDGYIPEPQIHCNDNRVTFYTFAESIGQRAAINFAASQAKGEFIMKLDAHCAVGEGFDVILAEDCKYEWTVVPRMYNLDIDTFKPKIHKLTDYMYISSPTSPKPFRMMYYSGDEYRKWHSRKELIDDTMCLVGCCFFMHKARFIELGGCDEKHVGGWGQQGVEVSLKAWLSGGALKVNKKTWFAHWFRGDVGFPYPISGRQVEVVRRYSQELWLNNKWDKQKRTIQWLVEKFNPPLWGDKPVADIEKRKEKVFKQHAHIKSIVFDMDYLIANLIDFRDQRRSLKRAKRRIETMSPFVKKVLNGETFTDKQLSEQPYYNALIYTQKTSPRKASELMRDLINLCASVKKEGVRNPLDLWQSRGKIVIHRGWRRLIIMQALGYKRVPCRVFESMTYFRRLAPNVKLQPDNSINGIAMKQFTKLGEKATDKYWLHQYTPLYDRHIGHKRNDECKILEIGVFRGASLALWKEAFTKAKVYGIDITDKWKELTPKDAKVFMGDQTDMQFLKNEVIPNGKYDIIIDDGGHSPSQMQASFKALWDSLNDKGVYVIEDLYGNYKKNKIKHSTMKMLKAMIDDMNINCTIRSMNFYYNICFIEKSTGGLNG